MDTVLIVKSSHNDKSSILFKYLTYVGICYDSIPEGGDISNNCQICSFDDFYETACKYQPRVIFIFDSESLKLIGNIQAHMFE